MKRSTINSSTQYFRIYIDIIKTIIPYKDDINPHEIPMKPTQRPAGSGSFDDVDDVDVSVSVSVGGDLAEPSTPSSHDTRRTWDVRVGR